MRGFRAAEAQQEEVSREAAKTRRRGANNGFWARSAIPTTGYAPAARDTISPSSRLRGVAGDNFFL
jgi:hypothetical protein